jgi:hypothetical protein
LVPRLAAGTHPQRRTYRRYLVWPSLPQSEGAPPYRPALFVCEYCQFKCHGYHDTLFGHKGSTKDWNAQIYFPFFMAHGVPSGRNRQKILKLQIKPFRKSIVKGLLSNLFINRLNQKQQ